MMEPATTTDDDEQRMVGSIEGGQLLPVGWTWLDGFLSGGVWPALNRHFGRRRV